MKKLKCAKIISVILTVAITLSVVVSGTNENIGMLYFGDVNGDNVVDITDVLEILLFLAGLDSVLDTNPVHFCEAGPGECPNNCEHHICHDPLPCIKCLFHKCAVETPENILGDSFTVEDLDETFPFAHHITLFENTASSPNTARAEMRFFTTATDPGMPTYMPTLQIRRGGVYVLSMGIDDEGNPVDVFNGQIYISARLSSELAGPGNPRPQEHVTLILNGVNIHAENGPAIHARRYSELDIIIIDGTVNNLSCGEDYAILYQDEPEEERHPQPSATIFSRFDMYFRGQGELNITSGHRHGIASRDDIFINGGNFNIDTTATIGKVNAEGEGVEGNGILGRDGLTINNATITINAANHGLRSNNLSRHTCGPREECARRMSINEQPCTKPCNTVIGGTDEAPELCGKVCGDRALEYSGFIRINGGKFTINAFSGNGIRADGMFESRNNPVYDIRDRIDRFDRDSEEQDDD